MLDKKYYTIAEASRITGMKPYVLRYWESEFRLLRPSRRESGQRRYSQDDIETVNKIKHLLYVEKFSIAGAKSKLLEERGGRDKQLNLEFDANIPALKLLQEIKKEIKEILKVAK